MLKFFGPGSKEKNELNELKQQINGYGTKPTYGISTCGRFFHEEPIADYYSPGLKGELKALQKEVKKLKAIVREVTDHVYKDNK